MAAKEEKKKPSGIPEKPETVGGAMLAIFARIFKILGIIFFAYAGLVILFLIGMALYALAEGKFDRYWDMLMSV